MTEHTYKCVFAVLSCKYLAVGSLFFIFVHSIHTWSLSPLDIEHEKNLCNLNKPKYVQENMEDNQNIYILNIMHVTF